MNGDAGELGAKEAPGRKEGFPSAAGCVQMGWKITLGTKHCTDERRH